MTPDRYAQIKELFFVAMELQGPERGQFLDEQCANDDQLRQEVASLLEHESSQTILASDSNTTEKRRGIGATRANAVEITLRTRSRIRQSGPRIPRLGSKGQLALGAAIAMALLALFGLWQRRNVNQSINQTLHERLNAMIDAHVESFGHWATFQQETVENWARNPDFLRFIEQLVRLDDSSPQDYANALRNAPAQAEIREKLKSAIGEDSEYVVLDAQRRIIAESTESALGLGKLVTSSTAARFADAYRGETTMFVENIQDMVHEESAARQDIDDVFVATPVRDSAHQIIAVIAIFDFDSALMQNAVRSMSQITETSETYAFNRDGMMLTDSRFNDELIRAGLLKPGQFSSNKIVIRDPGVNLALGEEPTTPLDTRPLTLMARYATAGHDGSDLQGYRNYLGTTVVGAWRWLPDYKTGFALEMARDEAYQPLRYVESQFILSFALLTVCVIGMLCSAFWISKLRRQVGNRQIGQYTLEKLIGEGGMGQVYKAKHAMLKRPCALKLLKPDQSNAKGHDWFESEVQAASNLSHPNTIQIFDYGTTDIGDFYYVMELLHGFDLDKLVSSFGPIPWPRVVYILRQVCFSLREAHEAGLVHRDIKPQNIMICRLGGEFDFVKVVDFGLVKNTDQNAITHTKTASLAGTPLYMAPERWSNTVENDPRSDIYAIGAVAYRLLSGREIYSADSTVGLIEKILSANVTPLSDLGCTDIPPVLEELVMSCLASNMDARPSSVSVILNKLESLKGASLWKQSDARQWWANWELASRGKEIRADSKTPENSA